eukprot:476874-Amphidinium_carterae.1
MPRSEATPARTTCIRNCSRNPKVIAHFGAMRLLVFSLHIVLYRGKFTGTSGGGFAVADPWRTLGSKVDID